MITEIRKNKKYQKLWNDYSQKFNLLSDKIIDAGIDIKLLKKVLNANKKLETERLETKIKMVLKQ